MGNIAGALESPRFTTLPRPSHSDAIYLPNCSSDAFITLLDLSPYNKKKKTPNSSARCFPCWTDGGKGARGERCTQHGATWASRGRKGMLEGSICGSASWQGCGDGAGSGQASPPKLGTSSQERRSFPKGSPCSIT